MPREHRRPPTDDLLYLISTVHNYHIFNDVHRDIDTNLSVLVDVLTAWKERSIIGVFNFISSWFVYGDVPMPATEDGPCKPRGFYSVTKLAAEGLVQSYCETFGLKYRILRLCGVYGPGDKPSKQKNALQWLIGELAAGRPIELYNGGNFTRDYLHVSDVVRAIDLCIDAAPTNTIINVGSGNAYRFADLIGMAAEHLGAKSLVGSCDPPDFHKAVQVANFSMDVSRLRGLGFVPQVSIEEGIEELCRLAVRK